MADSRQRGFRLWPWRAKTAAVTTTTTPPTAPALAEKLTELVHFERGVAALYYYLADETLVQLARTLCQSHQDAKIVDQGVDREWHTKDAAFEPWRAVSAVWYSDAWQPGEILATFGFRIIEALRAQNALWSVVIDPRAQFLGLAVTKDEHHRYWCTLVTGQKGQDMGGDTTTAAR